MLADLRSSVRALLSSPRFTLAAVVTLALGVAANAVIFSIMDGLVIHPFPAIDAPDRVVWLFETGGNVDLERDDVEPANFVDWRAQSKTLSAFGALRMAELTLTGAGDPERVSGQAVSAGYFQVMGLTPALGRFFGESEENEPVCVLGWGLWQRRFGGDRTVVGKTIEVNGRATTVVGVLPERFAFPRAVGMVVPISMTPAAWHDRTQGGFAALARLAPGAGVEQATAELDVIMKRLADDHPDTNKGLTVRPVPLSQVFNMRGAMTTLLLAVGFLLLIACANVANLSLARGVARRREIAVRQALGATRARLARQLLIETLLVSLAGAALGLVLAGGGLDLAIGALPPETKGRIAQLSELSINREVVVFAAALAGAITLLVGLVPALRASQVDLAAALKDGAGTAAPRRRRLMGALVVVEAALAMLLLGGAGVTLQAFRALASRPLGFHPDGVYTLRLPLAARHPDDADRVRFVDDALARLAAVPGVASVAATSAIPSTQAGGVGVDVVGRPPAPREQQPMAHVTGATPDLFRVLELPVVQGRGLAAGDRDSGERPMVISSSVARRLFGDEDPVGQRLRLAEGLGDRLIVGVAGDVPKPNARSTSIGELYLPYDGGDSTMIFALRANDPRALAGAARGALQTMDPRQVIEHPALLETILSEQIAAPRLVAWMVGVTSGIAWILAALGVYGLVAYSVGQRTREIGIRIALGASRGRVVGAMMRSVLILAAAGLILGLAAAVPLGRMIAASLFMLPGGAGMFLPLVIAAALFAAVAVLAALLPARRAARVDPMIALRAE